MTSLGKENENYISDIRILYVEDEEAIRDRLSRFLKRRTENVILAENGEEGLQAFKDNEVDIIVTDIRMPVMDGLTMAAHIREIDKDIPIIITTGHNDEEFFLRSIDIGVDKYIKKPINFKEFIEVISKFAGIVLQKQELDKQRLFVKNLMDINPNMILVTDGESVLYMNKTFLEYLQCPDYVHFQERFDSLDNFMVDDPECFTAGRKFNEWIKDVLENPEMDFTVRMRGCPSIDNFPISSFIIQVNQLPGSDEWLLIFSDITRVENEKQLYRIMSMQDPLTGIFNRKKFYDELIKEVDRVKRYGQKLSLIMFDVDKFKNVNDTYGHQKGDAVLKDITETVTETIRRTDVFARYGGEEFTVLMPGTDLEGAADIAERLRALIEEADYQDLGCITVSFGVSEYEEVDDIDSFIRKADVALYRAKDNGRNRVEKFVNTGIICRK